MSTELTYNGVVLRDCETLSFDQKIEYDESKTDVMYSRFRIRVRTTLVDYLDPSVSTIDTEGYTVVQRMQTVHRLLSQARKRFWFEMNGVHLAAGHGSGRQTLLMAVGADEFNDPARFPNGLNTLIGDSPVALVTDTPARAVVDVDNGPKPIDVSVEQIYGGRAMRVTFEIEVCRILCHPSDFTFNDPYPTTEPNTRVRPDGGRIISNRWSVTETRDANWVTTRVIQGTLRTRDKSVVPHLMRYFVLPSLLKNYQRKHQHFATDPTDLVLKYRIEDVQKDANAAPPPPAIDWSGHYVESTDKLGMHQHAEISLRLQGPPGVDKQDLISAGGHVINSRIRGLQKQPGDDQFETILENASIVEVIGQPVIEFRVRVRYVDGLDAKKLRLRLGNIGAPLVIAGYKPDEWPVPLPHDSEHMAGVFSCYLQRPCSVWHAVPTLRPGEREHEDGDEERAVEEESGAPDIPPSDLYNSNQPFLDDDTALDPEAFNGSPYTLIEIDSQYLNDTGWHQLPYASDTPVDNETCHLFKMSGGVAERIFTMEAVRQGIPPVIPEPIEELVDFNGIKEKLAETSINLAAPEFKGDGVVREFRVHCRYRYLLSRPPTNAEKLRMAISPIDNTPGEDRLMDTADLFSATAIEWRAGP